MPLRIIIRNFSVLLFLSASALGGHPRNIILCIGDGMGPEQIQAARYYLGTNLAFETFPFQSTMTTHSVYSNITDSAASGTAMATGVKVNNEVTSISNPGNGSELETVLEYYKALGKSTGLITTSYMTDASPAAFGAHASSRSDLGNIANDYLTQTRPNVLFGGGENGLSPAAAESAGYTITTNRAELLALDTETVSMVSGQFGGDRLPFMPERPATLPRLYEMTETALDILDNDPDGFFLFLEEEHTDSAGHNQDIQNVTLAVAELSLAVESILNWMGDRTDTLLIVTADHETGGLSVTNNGVGNYPFPSWSTPWHTSTPVPVYATGQNAAYATNVLDNTDIYGLLMHSARVPEQIISCTADSTHIQTVWTAYSNDVYRLEQSYDPSSTNWMSENTTTANSSRLSFSIPLSVSSNQVFYRLISE